MIKLIRTYEPQSNFSSLHGTHGANPFPPPVRKPIGRCAWSDIDGFNRSYERVRGQ